MNAMVSMLTLMAYLTISNSSQAKGTALSVPTKESSMKWDEEDWYIFHCPTCGKDFVVDNDYDSSCVCSYGECPECVAMFNAGM